MPASLLVDLEAALGHRFRRPELLQRALTHSSGRQELPVGETAEDNERLEFLGDAILGMLVSEHLLTTFAEWTEGQLSRTRAGLVNEASLHAAALRLNLGQYLRLGRGEEKTGGRKKPGMLADAYEAVIAAIYLDAGLEAARGFVAQSLLDAAAEQAAQMGRGDHKSALQELLQRRGQPPAEYRVANETGPDHRKTFLVEVIVGGQALASAEGATKKDAEQAAAGLALQQLTGGEG
jgi:ribonuclease-3